MYKQKHSVYLIPERNFAKQVISSPAHVATHILRVSINDLFSALTLDADFP